MIKESLLENFNTEDYPIYGGMNNSHLEKSKWGWSIDSIGLST